MPEGIKSNTFASLFRIPLRLVSTVVLALIALATLLLSANGLSTALAQSSSAVRRATITLGSSYLIVEGLNNHLIHFELSAVGSAPSGPIYSSPMVANASYAGPSSWSDTTSGNIRTFATPDTSVAVDTTTLCATVKDLDAGVTLTTYCPKNITSASDLGKGLTMTPNGFVNGYGLGADYITAGSADGDWIGTSGHQRRRAGGPWGNARVGWNYGNVGNIQYPVLYALDSTSHNYAMFLDNYYKQEWDFSVNPWTVQMNGDWIRWYVMTGADLPTLRKAYMDLVGHPLGPPKKMFGMWVSTYGYHQWSDIDNKLTSASNSLINSNFPVDGFVLDLYWFGGVGNNNYDLTSEIGNLDWVTGQSCCNFTTETTSPTVATTIANYKNSQGVGIMSIEESYEAAGTSWFNTLSAKGDLVRDGSSTASPAVCTTTYQCSESDGRSNYAGYFGQIGMVDWTNPNTAAWVHLNKRKPDIIDQGIIGHWLDLGEPEILAPNGWYNGFDPHIGLNPAGLHTESDIHNMFNFFFIQGLYNGYQGIYDSRPLTQRPFMMARSGAPGIQRYGATNWSNDIGSNFSSLATWSNVQMHMSMSGMDYYSSDIGGFQREACANDPNCDYNQLFTQWYATGMMFDVPGRPHSDSFDKSKTDYHYETTPSMVGNVSANQFNTRRRYELSPYSYSLAYPGYLYGEPTAPPLVYYYQTDSNVRAMGNEKLLGHDLLAAIVASQGEYKRGIYLPAGDWVSYDTNEWFHSSGQWFNNGSGDGYPEYRANMLRLPLFARSGAIIPTMYVDNQTGNVLGFRRDGSTRNDLIAKVYASTTATNFTLYEDDGTTDAYTTGAYQTTLLSQQKTSSTSEQVVINPTVGSYTGAPTTRNYAISLAAENQTATGVTSNGSSLTQYTDLTSYNNATGGGYINVTPSMTNSAGLGSGYTAILAKASNSQSVNVSKTFVFTLTSATAQASMNFVCPNTNTVFGQSVFIVGSIAALGNWNTANAVKLDPSIYPTWTGVIQILPTSTNFQYQCIKRDTDDSNGTVWQNVPNTYATMASSGYSGTTTGNGNW